MNSDNSLKIEIDHNVLNHLGIGLYSSTPAVVSEIIANAWDADATTVKVTLDIDNDRIVIVDDGHGMSRNDVQTKFLRVGYARRDAESEMSKSGKRRVMGRKGIGKLAMFSLANQIEIISKADHEEDVGARIIVDDLKKSINSNKAYELEPITKTSAEIERGTRIVLSKLNSRINKTDSYLRPRLARRFGIIGPQYGFEIELNNTVVTKSDRQFYADLELLWPFDDSTMSDLASLAKQIATLEGKRCEKKLDQIIDIDGAKYAICGFIGTVDKPKKLQKVDENINQISIFANGRVFQEDILAELGNSDIFNNYIIGEVHADFLDTDNVDRATSNREAIKHDDPLFQALKAKLAKELREVAKDWDNWRRELGYSRKPEAIPAIKDWINGLDDPRDQKIADRLMVSINNINFSNDENENNASKLQLFRSTIVGFEKLKARKQLHKLESVTDVLSPEFQAIFSTINDVEETYFHDITNSRLAVINKFASIIDKKELEKVAQRYLYDHLWLLDPTWGRVARNKEIEQVLTDELRKASPSEESGARLDIAYRTGIGRHAIIELKKPGLTTIDFFALLKQGEKYQKAVHQYFKDHPDIDNFQGRFPPIDLFFLVEKGFSEDESKGKMLDAINARVLTYQGLLQNAKSSYAEYLDANKQASKIDEILSKLEN